MVDEVSESESSKKLSTVSKKKPLAFKQPSTAGKTTAKKALSTLKFSPAMAKANSLLGEGSAI